jgi:hypothetical protein
MNIGLPVRFFPMRSEELEQLWTQLRAKSDVQLSHLEGFANVNVQQAIDACETAMQRDMTYGERLAFEAELKRLRQLHARVAAQAAILRGAP